MDDHQDLGEMATQVESWFQAVTSITDGDQNGDIISPIDFVPSCMLQSGAQRDVAHHASKTMAPRADVIAAAIAAGQATVKSSRKETANLCGDMIEEKKRAATEEARKGFFYPVTRMCVPRKFQPIVMQQYMKFLRLGTLGLMACCGIVLMYLTIERLGHEAGGVHGLHHSLHHHSKKFMKSLRGSLVGPVDKHNKCPEWVSLGGCVSNPVFMHESCAKSCSLKSVDASGIHLSDTHDHCTQWAGRGECVNNPKFMMMECAKSCSLLGSDSLHEAHHAGAPATNTVASAFAQDKSEHCHEWALGGECQSNAAFMLKECQKSCGSP